MSPEDNKAIIRAHVEALLSQHRVDQAKEFFTPDYLDHAPRPDWVGPATDPSQTGLSGRGGRDDQRDDPGGRRPRRPSPVDMGTHPPGPAAPRMAGRGRAAPGPGALLCSEPRGRANIASPAVDGHRHPDRRRPQGTRVGRPGPGRHPPSRRVTVRDRRCHRRQPRPHGRVVALAQAAVSTGASPTRASEPITQSFDSPGVQHCRQQHQPSASLRLQPSLPTVHEMIVVNA